jgi:hypothetical protein
MLPDSLQNKDVLKSYLHQWRIRNVVTKTSMTVHGKRLDIVACGKPHNKLLLNKKKPNSLFKTNHKIRFSEYLNQ